MASSVEATTPTMGREEEAICDPPPPPSSPAAAPSSAQALPPPPAAPVAPPALPSASTKRRWSPCTWRYAIEEAQAELPSRARSSSAFNSGALSSSRTTSFPTPSLQHHPMKAKPLPPPHHSKPSAEDAVHRSSLTPSRVYPAESAARMRFSPSQYSHPHSSSKRRITELPKKSQHQLLCVKGRLSDKEEEEEEDDAEQDEHENDDGNNGDSDDGMVAARFDEAYFRRRRREMSPSEVYFCSVCSAVKGATISAHEQEL